MKNRVAIIALLSIMALFMGVALVQKNQKGHAGESAQEHAKHSESEQKDVHAEEAGVHLELTDSMILKAGITIGTVGTTSIAETASAYGEIRYSPEAISSITPTYPSTVVRVNVKQGDAVRVGTVVAVLMNRETLTEYSIISPRSGTVLERSVNGGESVSDGDVLMTVADLGAVRAELAVSERVIGDIKIGTSVSVITNDESVPMRGKVTYISPEMDTQTRKVTVRATLTGMNKRVRPGSFIAGTIELNRGSSALAVPSESIVMIDNEPIVFVPDADEKGAFKPMGVKTGRSSSTYTEILSGLQANDSFVKTGAFALKAEMVTANMDPHAGHGH